MPWRHLAVLLLGAVSAALPGCLFDDEVPIGTLRVFPTGMSGGRSFDIEGFDVIEFKSPSVDDLFALAGKKCAVLGKIYPMSAVGQGEGVRRLVGKEFPIESSGRVCDKANKLQYRQGTFEIPELGKIAMASGHKLTVEKVEEIDGVHVVSGTFKFTLETEKKGQALGFGQFRAKLRVIHPKS